MTMGDEKKHKSTIIRRPKKQYGKSFNKELRQSVHELTTNLNDLHFGNQQGKPTGGLKRSRSFYKEEHVQVSVQSSREILKQYVVNLQINDNEDAESTDSDTKSEIESNTEKKSTPDSPIFTCIDENNFKELAVSLLKDESINLESTNNDGQTPLIYALCLGFSDIAKLLITSGADVTAIDNYGVTALRYAVEDGDFEVASLLIEKGANASSVANGC